MLVASRQATVAGFSSQSVGLSCSHIFQQLPGIRRVPRYSCGYGAIGRGSVILFGFVLVSLCGV